MEAKFGRDAEINLAGVIWIGFFRSFAVVILTIQTHAI